MISAIFCCCAAVIIALQERTRGASFRDGVPHKTKAYAIAKPAHHPIIIKQKQQFEKTVLNSRSQEVSRETARKTPKSVRYDIWWGGEVRRFKRKTPQNKALCGVFVFGSDSLRLLSWRRRSPPLRYLGESYSNAYHLVLLTVFLFVSRLLPRIVWLHIAKSGNFLYNDLYNDSCKLPAFPPPEHARCGKRP
jgi:hypothetical protein